MTIEPPGGQVSRADGGRDVACIEVVELVTEYLEGTLTPVERARVERHLGQCEGCTRYVEQIRATIAATGRLTPEAVPDEAIDPLLEAFRAARVREG